MSFYETTVRPTTIVLEVHYLIVVHDILDMMHRSHSTIQHCSLFCFVFACPLAATGKTRDCAAHADPRSQHTGKCKCKKMTSRFFCLSDILLILYNKYRNVLSGSTSPPPHHVLTHVVFFYGPALFVVVGKRLRSLPMALVWETLISSIISRCFTLGGVYI